MEEQAELFGKTAQPRTKQISDKTHAAIVALRAAGHVVVPTGRQHRLDGRLIGSRDLIRIARQIAKARP